VHLGDITNDLNFGIKFLERFSCDCAGGDTPDRFPRRCAAPALPVSNSVLRLVGEVGMGRPKSILEISIVLWSGVFVAYQKCNRRPEASGLKNSGQDFAAILFFPLGRDAALAGAAPVELTLNIALQDFDPGRAAIDYDANPAPMRFTEGCHPKKLAKGVAHQEQN
jgi:hypothetical protein